MGEDSMRYPDKGLVVAPAIDQSYFYFTHVPDFLTFSCDALLVP